MVAIKILMLGPPGAGKGVISQRLQEKYDFPQISAGDLLRDEIKKETKLGKMIDKIISNGSFLSDDLVIKIIKKRLKEKDCEKGFILDGFPRTMNQAEEFEEISGFNLVLNFIVAEKDIIKRISTRRICEKCGRIYNIITLKPKKEDVCDICNGKLIQRKDDTEEIIKKRLEIYKKETSPLIDFYNEKKFLININGARSVEEVFFDASNIVDKFLESYEK